MTTPKRFTPLSIATLASVVLAACAAPAAPPAAPAATEAPAPAAKLTPVRVVLQWVPQSQFAGYYAAKDKGFYAEEGLDVTIIPGGPDIAPAQVVASDGAEFGVAWLPGRTLAAREGGADLVNIAQIFQRSGTLMVSFKREEYHQGRRLQGQERRLMAAGQRGRTLRRNAQGRPGPR
jgi:ABC-type nitrate/sulfonate/bicarbonate transport systems, periplasmic components